MGRWMAGFCAAAVMSFCCGRIGAETSTLDQRIHVYDAKDLTISEALREIVAQLDRAVVIGLERVPAPAAHAAEPKITVHIEDGTIREILEQVCEQDWRYAFADAGEGVINVYPAVEASEPASILDFFLDRVDIEVRDWPANLFARIPELAPKLGTYLEARARQYQMRTSRLPPGTPGVIMTTGLQPPRIEIHLRKTSVRGVLNAIAAYTLKHPVTDEAGNVHGSPTGWEFRFIIDPEAATGLGGHPNWLPFPFP